MQPQQVLAYGCRSVGVNEVTAALAASEPGVGDLRRLAQITVVYRTFRYMAVWGFAELYLPATSS